MPFSGAAFAIWYPELTNRLSGNDGARICDIFSSPRHLEIIVVNSTTTEGICVVAIDDKMYIDNLIVGVGYLVANIGFFSTIQRFRISYLIITATAISSISAFLLPSLTDELWIVICFTLFLIGCGASISIFNTLVVAIFPTYICGMALGLVLLTGRGGTVVGSNGLGILLETHCEATIYGVAVLVAAAMVCVILLPKKIKM